MQEASIHMQRKNLKNLNLKNKPVAGSLISVAGYPNDLNFSIWK